MYVCHRFYYTFQALEGLLNVYDERHTFILHLVFIPRINQAVTSFTVGWNKHPLRTERDQSPENIWNNGIIDQRNRNQIQVAEFHDNIGDDDMQWFGFDAHAPSPTDNGSQQVKVFDQPSSFSKETRNLDGLKHSSFLYMCMFMSILLMNGHIALRP
ncbi:uncharacterized protein LOC130646286 [Hydractinia symbiolongicarpus]|uniref:uncharacterized protein LOC130646286 n=1 Tax=Hydractinia symbiolongicarpus TaxID=13093 RepID=UPI00254A55F4|nr:uncharacterized protein LOC130646286 [Hydractinia symbiolongicarpus]